MTVFVLSIPIPRIAASVDMTGFNEDCKPLTRAEHCPPCINCTVITGAETDLCWYTDGTLIDDATLSASSALSIDPDTFIRLSPGVPAGEILRKREPRLLDAFVRSISFSLILALRANSSCKSFPFAISFCSASLLNFFAVLLALSKLFTPNGELVLHLMFLKTPRFCCFRLCDLANVCSILALINSCNLHCDHRVPFVHRSVAVLLW